MIQIIKLSIKENEEEILFESINKNNNILLLNKQQLLYFYFLFYKTLVLKNKNYKITIGEKNIESKNSILLTFIDFKEILDSLTFKKGTLFYEFILSLINSTPFEHSDKLFEEIEVMINTSIIPTSLPISCEINNNLEKLITSIADFNIDFTIEEISSYIEILLNKYISINPLKTIIIFYDSSIMNLNLIDTNQCYFFDINLSFDISQYNLICSSNISSFSLTRIKEQIENIWPIDYKESKIELCIITYFRNLIFNEFITANDEYELLTFSILNKILNKKIEIKVSNFQINDNIKSFLTKI